MRMTPPKDTSPPPSPNDRRSAIARARLIAERLTVMADTLESRAGMAQTQWECVDAISGVWFALGGAKNDDVDVVVRMALVDLLSRSHMLEAFGGTEFKNPYNERDFAVTYHGLFSDLFSDHAAPLTIEDFEKAIHAWLSPIREKNGRSSKWRAVGDLCTKAGLRPVKPATLQAEWKRLQRRGRAPHEMLWPGFVIEKK